MTKESLVKYYQPNTVVKVNSSFFKTDGQLVEVWNYGEIKSVNIEITASNIAIWYSVCLRTGELIMVSPDAINPLGITSEEGESANAN